MSYVINGDKLKSKVVHTAQVTTKNVKSATGSFLILSSIIIGVIGLNGLFEQNTMPRKVMAAEIISESVIEKADQIKLEVDTTDKNISMAKKIQDYLDKNAPESTINGEMIESASQELNLSNDMVKFILAHCMFETKCGGHPASTVARECKSPWAVWVWKGKCNRPGGAYKSEKLALYDYISRMDMYYITNRDPLTFIDNRTLVQRYKGNDSNTVDNYINGVKMYMNQINL